MRLRLKIAGAGKGQWLEMDAASADEARRQAARQGLRVLAVAGDSAPAARLRPGRRQGFHLLLFTQELMALLDAGLNVVEAIETLSRKETVSANRAVLDRILVDLREGKRLSDAFAVHPAIFPKVFVAGVLAAELNGTLPQALGRFSAYELQMQLIRKKVISASLYPAILLGFGVMVTLFLLGYVVPKFSTVLSTSGREPALASRLMMEAGRFLHDWPGLVIGVAAALIGGALLVVINPRLRATALSRLARLPLLAGVARLFALARFYRTVSLLLESGIALPRALEMSRALLPPELAAALDRGIVSLRAGLPLSKALQGSALLTPIAESLMRVGERSGKLAEMLERSARFLDEELSRGIDTFARVFEPLLMGIIGIIIGVVVVLMYMPIFDLVGSFQ